MALLKGILIAFSMFSSIPMPQTEWDEHSMRWCLCGFPLVGAAVALASWIWSQLCIWLKFPDLLRAAGFCLLPVLLTGGIHLDGYADTCDALASNSSREKMQEILKDPHLGTFAVVRLIVWFLACFALWTGMPEPGLAALLGLYGLPRCLSGLALTIFPLRPGSGLARTFAETAKPKTVRAVLAVLAVLFTGLLLGSGGILSCAGAALCFIRYRKLCDCFGGLSGDLAGWFVQKTELWILGLLVFGRYAEALL